MVLSKDKTQVQSNLIDGCKPRLLDDSALYLIITSSSADKVASLTKKAIFSDDEDVGCRCPLTGMTYMHLVAANYEKFIDPVALPAAYQLCYAGINVSAQDNAGNTALHLLVQKPNTYKLIVMLLRYGINISLKNSEGMTAQDILETQCPPGYEANLHWFRKLSPGLYCAVVERDSCGGATIDRETVEQMLKAWCRVNICVDGQPRSLLSMSQMRAKDALLAQTLKHYCYTNELVHATLAGLPEEMKRIYKEAKKKIDVDTKDHSYQLDSNSPEVPQPLIAAAWEQSNFAVVDALMNMNVDVCNSYSNQSPDVYPTKPMFYSTLMGVPPVNDLNIMLRILENGDLRCKTEKATTFLHESVIRCMPPLFIERLLTLGVPLEEREHLGHTARELAVNQGSNDLVRVMDDVVLERVNALDIKYLEELASAGYNLPAVATAAGRTLQQRAECDELPSKLKKFVLKTIPTMDVQMRELWKCVDANNLVKLKKYLSSKDMKKAVYSRDRCGRTILLMALLNRNLDAVKLILKKHRKLIEYFDNHMLTCLHYAYLFFEEDCDPVVEVLLRYGASHDWCCILGKMAHLYRKGVADEDEYRFCQTAVANYSLEVFANHTTFGISLNEAMQSGNLPEVERLADNIRPYSSIKPFSHMLFDAVDSGHEEVVIYLLQQGCDGSIMKQYETCDPENMMCAMQECCHPSTSLIQRAQQKNMLQLVSFLSTNWSLSVDDIDDDDDDDDIDDANNDCEMNGDQASHTDDHMEISNGDMEPEIESSRL